MLRLLGLVISIGLADSINPSTIAPALYLATGKENPRSQVAQFTVSVFVVYLAGGALIAIGPGQLLRTAFDLDVQQTIRHVAEIVAGVVLLISAELVWRRRGRLLHRGIPGADPKRRSSAWLGATITAVELPTAFPYFAAIAAILGSGAGPIRQLVLLVVFNVCFVLPLIAIVATLTFAGESSERILATWRDFLNRRWPQLLAALLVIIGIVGIVFGATGLAAQGSGRVGHFFRHIRKIFHLHP
ncbi:MAG TPA: GAP family protein [Solirubrobacteraceae bacterium]|nr:GAP family protein [Solirubrobacteraceae bacterium]